MTNSYRTGILLCLILMLSACNKSYQRAYRHTEEIKKYGLVFRLQDYKQRIDYFEKKGLADRAKAEKSKIDEDNRNLVQYFQKEFSYCPVRFFYASQQDALLEGKPVLLNAALEPDASVPLPEKVFRASFTIGKVVDNSFEWRAFRVEGTSIHIRPTLKTWWGSRPIQRQDIQRVNRIIYKMNNAKYSIRS